MVCIYSANGDLTCRGNKGEAFAVAPKEDCRGYGCPVGFACDRTGECANGLSCIKGKCTRVNFVGNARPRPQVDPETIAAVLKQLPRMDRDTAVAVLTQLLNGSSSSGRPYELGVRRDYDSDWSQQRDRRWDPSNRPYELGVRRDHDRPPSFFSAQDALPY
jgi:hypothetical protein